MSHRSNAVTDDPATAAPGAPLADAPLSDSPADMPPQEVADADNQPTSLRQILLRNAFLLSVIAVAFFTGVFAAETVGTYMDRQAHAESEAAEDDSLLFK